MALINRLSPETERELPALRQLCWELASNTGQCVRPTFEEKLAELYSRMELPAPKFVWAEGIGEAATYVGLKLKTDWKATLGGKLLAQIKDVSADHPLRKFAALALRAPLALGEEVPTEEQSEYFLKRIWRRWLNSRTPGLTNSLSATARFSLEREFVRGFSADANAIHGRMVRNSLVRHWADFVFLVPEWDQTWNQSAFGIFTSSLLGPAMLAEVAAQVGVDYSLPIRRRHQFTLDLCKAGFWFWPGKRVCVCCERPYVFRINQENRLHCADGPALAFQDGFEVFAIDGVDVPDFVVTRPHEISVKLIDAEQNAEVRRVMTERFGYGRYLTETKAKVLDMDVVSVHTLDESFGSMPRALMEDKQGLRWLVGTDGSTKRVYYMRAPDEAKTCAEAHSLLAGFDENQIIASS